MVADIGANCASLVGLVPPVIGAIGATKDGLPIASGNVIAYYSPNGWVGTNGLPIRGIKRYGH